MRVVLLTRYPRVDTTRWKLQLGERLLESDVELFVVYTRSDLMSQARAGLREFGSGSARKYLSARRSDADGREQPQSLADWGTERGLEVSFHRRLGDGDCLARLREIAPDAILLAGADIVPPAVLEIPKLGTINGHYGLLPRYRGMNVTEWSIYHDDPVGVSVHLVDSGIDTGPIVAREPLPVDEGERLEDLRSKHQQACARLLAEVCLRMRTETVTGKPQAPEEGRQYYRMHPELRKRVEAKLRDGVYRWSRASREELLTESPALP